MSKAMEMERYRAHLGANHLAETYSVEGRKGRWKGMFGIDCKIFEHHTY